MATIVYEEEYCCHDDCQMVCPKPRATLTFQSTSNAYTFDTGMGQVIYLNQSQAQLLYDLLHKLGEHRSDSITLKK